MFRKVKPYFITLIIIAGLVFWWKLTRLPIPPGEESKPVDKIIASDWVLGNPEGIIQVVEYSDFQCPACAYYKDFGNDLAKLYGDKVGFAFRHYPLREIHKNSDLSAQAAEVAGKQGKFFEMAEVLFENQSDWSESPKVLEKIVSLAESIGLNKDDFRREIDDKNIKALVEADYLSGLVARIDQTPTFYVNGQKMNNLQGPSDLMARVELALQEATKSGLTQ